MNIKVKTDTPVKNFYINCIYDAVYQASYLQSFSAKTPEKALEFFIDKLKSDIKKGHVKNVNSIDDLVNMKITIIDNEGNQKDVLAKNLNISSIKCVPLVLESGILIRKGEISVLHMDDDMLFEDIKDEHPF